MKIIIQVILIAAVAFLAWKMGTSRGQRGTAIRRVFVGLFAIIAIFSIIFPEIWTNLAALVGVGRGTDLLLYALVIAFLGSMLVSHLRFKDFEVRFTKLARSIALDQAAREYPHITKPTSTPNDENA